MKRFSILVFILSFVFVQAAFAETTVSNSSSTSGTNSTAKKSGGLANIAKTASTAAAAAFLAKAIAAPPPQKPLYYALAAANVGAALMMSGAAKNAGQVERATLGAPSSYPTVGYDPSMPDGSNGDSGSGYDPSSAGFDSELAALDQQIRDAGYNMSADGSKLTLPSGETVSTAAIASGSVPGMRMSDEMKAQAAAIEAEAMKKASGANVVAIGLSEGGGGGGGSAMGGADNSSKFDMSAYLNKLKNRDPSSVSGLSKKLGEDNIGIKTDNIFEMVSRQYKRKQTQRAFMN